MILEVKYDYFLPDSSRPCSAASPGTTAPYPSTPCAGAMPEPKENGDIAMNKIALSNMSITPAAIPQILISMVLAFAIGLFISSCTGHL